MGYFAENHATIFGILGFIFLAAGVGVTVATLNRARNSGGKLLYHVRRIPLKFEPEVQKIIAKQGRCYSVTSFDQMMRRFN